jgi:AraC-like DNA-binding protein
MTLIDNAIAAFELQEPNKQLSLQAIAKRFGVKRSTLGQRVRGLTRPQQVKAVD